MTLDQLIEMLEDLRVNNEGSGDFEVEVQGCDCEAPAEGVRIEPSWNTQKKVIMIKR